jgi:hypothetical protein
MKILYSFNKKGLEARYWTAEIAAASSAKFKFIPFNPGSYLDPQLYLRAHLLDNPYFARHRGSRQLYSQFEAMLAELKCIVANPCSVMSLPARTLNTTVVAIHEASEHISSTESVPISSNG